MRYNVSFSSYKNYLETKWFFVNFVFVKDETHKKSCLVKISTKFNHSTLHFGHVACDVVMAHEIQSILNHVRDEHTEI